LPLSIKASSSGRIGNSALRVNLDHHSHQSTMRELQKIVMAALICSIGAYSQQTTPAPKQTVHPAVSVRVVNIRFVTGAGMCIGCYCSVELRVTPAQAILRLAPFRDCQQQNPSKYREYKVTADLSNKHWHELEELVKHDALFGLPDRIGCPGCADGPTEFVEVEFKDRTKKSVFYGSPPAEIKALSEKLNALEGKLERELPPAFPPE
jgi:hypothetical protein